MSVWRRLFGHFATPTTITFALTDIAVLAPTCDWK